MYKTAIKNALNYTRPLILGKLIYKNKNIINDISSLIVLNENGDILTTSRNADIFLACNEYNETYPKILKEIHEAKPRKTVEIEKKYGINENTIVGMHNTIIDIANNPGNLKIIKHPYLDMAVISIQNKDNILVRKYPKFSSINTEIGESICAVGFAFPEYKAFSYDEENFKIKSTYEFMNFPIFPSEGIMCRNISDKEENLSMFEMSNNIVKGLEGGPILNKKGLVVGMTLGHIIINDENGPVKLGMGVNTKTIIKFLNDNNIKYYKEVNNE